MADKSDRLLGSRQRKVVGAALSFLSALLIAGLALVVFYLLQQIVSFFSKVIWPLAVAGILALMLRPVILFFQGTLHLSRFKAIVLLYLLVVMVCGGVLALILPTAIAQIVDFITLVPALIENARQFLEEQFPQLWEKLSGESMQPYLKTFVEGIRQVAVLSLPAIRETGAWVTELLGTAAATAIIPIYLFYFLQSDRDPTQDLGNQLSFLKKDLKEDLLFLAREFANIIVAFFRGQLLIGVIMGILLALGFSLAGLKFGLVLGLILGFLNIMPYLGTILGLATALPIAFLQPDGGWLTMGLTVLVFILVQAIEGYLLTPKIMGKQTGLHPLAVIISIFFWGTALNGLLGMILAIPLTAFFIIAWRLVKHQYLDPVKNS